MGSVNKENQDETMGSYSSNLSIFSDGLWIDGCNGRILGIPRE